MQFSEQYKKRLTRSKHTIQYIKGLKYTEWMYDEWYKIDRHLVSDHLKNLMTTYKIRMDSQ